MIDVEIVSFQETDVREGSYFMWYILVCFINTASNPTGPSVWTPLFNHLSHDPECLFLSILFCFLLLVKIDMVSPRVGASHYFSAMRRPVFSGKISLGP